MILMIFSLKIGLLRYAFIRARVDCLACLFAIFAVGANKPALGDVVRYVVETFPPCVPTLVACAGVDPVQGPIVYQFYLHDLLSGGTVAIGIIHHESDESKLLCRLFMCLCGMAWPCSVLVRAGYDLVIFGWDSGVYYHHQKIL